MMSNPFTFIDKQADWYNKKTKTLNAYRLAFQIVKFERSIINMCQSFKRAKTESECLQSVGQTLADAFKFRDNILEIAGKKKPKQFPDGGFTGHGSDEVSLTPKINCCNEFRTKA